MTIRRAEEKDMEGINKLLQQVCLVHHKGRPDLFKFGAKKYTDDELKAIIHDDKRPIFVATDEKGTVLGYAFCIFQQHLNDIFPDIMDIALYGGEKHGSCALLLLSALLQPFLYHRKRRFCRLGAH